VSERLGTGKLVYQLRTVSPLGRPQRITDLCYQAADEIERLQLEIGSLQGRITNLIRREHAKVEEEGVSGSDCA
jgi:hypothetical protein